MADNFNLKGYLKKNTLLKENIGGYVDIQPMREDVNDPWGWNKQAQDDENFRKNRWIADIDRMQDVDGWKASWDYPGVISWTHSGIDNVQVVATPEWDGPGTPIELVSGDGSTKVLKVLDQDEFETFEDYAAAIKPYLDKAVDDSYASDY